MPVPFIGLLSVSSAVPVTNKVSSYTLGFTMQRMPFESGLEIQFSTRHKIEQNGRCFVEVTPGDSLGYGVDCQVLN